MRRRNGWSISARRRTRSQRFWGPWMKPTTSLFLLGRHVPKQRHAVSERMKTQTTRHDVTINEWHEPHSPSRGFSVSITRPRGAEESSSLRGRPEMLEEQHPRCGMGVRATRYLLFRGADLCNFRWHVGHDVSLATALVDEPLCSGAVTVDDATKEGVSFGEPTAFAMFSGVCASAKIAFGKCSARSCFLSSL